MRRGTGFVSKFIRGVHGLLWRKAMRRFWGLCLLAGTATLLSLSQTLAQSGVVSGPPQIRPEAKPQAPPPLPQVGGWIAVAAGFDGSGQKVSVGYSGHQSTRAEAENEALRFCNNVDRAVSCRDPFAVSNGCLYI